MNNDIIAKLHRNNKPQFQFDSVQEVQYTRDPDQAP